jgi:hypothetical protein
VAEPLEGAELRMREDVDRLMVHARERLARAATPEAAARWRAFIAKLDELRATFRDDADAKITARK